MRYTYDFGDDWEHDVVLEKVLPPDRVARLSCLAGKGACPPEDCGGPWGYASMKEILADPDHEEHEDLLDWLNLDSGADFDPALFASTRWTPGSASFSKLVHEPIHGLERRWR